MKDDRKIGEGDCFICGGCGQVSITIQTEYGEMEESFGCPGCIQAECDEVIAELKMRIAELERMVRSVQSRKMPAGSNTVSEGGAK
ncbi:hypothetical protein LH427_04540 [Laribacter hongkongensis]|uniref:hypothetical protein n=1 Tax=Laribacter hongkongensis TaxID=168471 RepID=UPI001EFD3BFB|nr:hypothetical protein [Laribacter hongkongensis]MCG9061195.1 hypothetical protein [Laribacter hongkongensis]